ncbi:Uncharacterised protein [Vibrio cholerae]|nr:Uncharacterised protein [Vibrio cholerae]
MRSVSRKRMPRLLEKCTAQKNPYLSYQRRLLHRQYNPVRSPESCSFSPCALGILQRSRCSLPETLQTGQSCVKRTVVCRFLRSVFHPRLADRRSKVVGFSLRGQCAESLERRKLPLQCERISHPRSRPEFVLVDLQVSDLYQQRMLRRR